MPVKFRFRLIPFIAALTAAIIGISLGQWQSRRAAEKEAIEARMLARESESSISLNPASSTINDLEFRRVRVKGEFIPGWTIYLDNRPYKGAAGFYVLTPMKMAGSDEHVLIARGWTKRDIADRTKLSPVPVPGGIVEIEGVGRRNIGHVLQLGNAERIRPGVIVQNVEIAEFGHAANLKMLPLFVEQRNDTQDGLVRDWPRPSAGVEKHRGYAFQWNALAFMALIFFVVTGIRRGTN